jgi:hypothetical protein
MQKMFRSDVGWKTFENVSAEAVLNEAGLESLDELHMDEQVYVQD